MNSFRTLLFTGSFLLSLSLPVAAQVDRSKAPEPGPAPKIALGDYDSFTLDNGLKVFVIENHKLPRVSFQLTVDRDATLEGEKAGVTSLAGSLMRNGTTTRSKQQIDEEVDFIGASLFTFSRGMFGSSLTKHRGKLLELMSDVLMNPTFPEEEFAREQKTTLSGLAANKDDANAIAGNVGNAVLYGKDHPYGELTTEETVKSITTADCKKYFETYFRPNISYLVIVGDIKTGKAKELVTRYFGEWEKKEVPSHKWATPKTNSGTRVVFVHKEGAVQSVVSVLHTIDLKPGSEDVIKANVMNSILGGGVFSGRLMQNLREDKAYTYGARSSLSSDRLVGEFSASAQVRNEVTDSAVAEFLFELNRIGKEPVTADELSLTLNQMNGGFARSLESPQTIAEFALNTERHNLPKDYYATYLEKLSKVTIADVQAMGKKYVKPDNAVILVVGDRNEVAEKLKQFSAKNEVEFLDIYAEEFVDKMKAAPDDVTAELVIANYIKVLGGAENLSSVKDLSETMSMKMGGNEFEIHTKRKSPDLYYQTFGNAAMMVSKEVYDGEKGLRSGMQIPNGPVAIEGEELEEMKSNAAIYPELHYAEMGSTVRLMGMEAVEGKDCYVVEVTSKSGKKEFGYFDVASGLKLQDKVTEETPMGVQTSITMYLDYKSVDGVMFPHKLVTSAAGRSVELNSVSIKVNSGLTKADFQ